MAEREKEKELQQQQTQQQRTLFTQNNNSSSQDCLDNQPSKLLQSLSKYHSDLYKPTNNQSNAMNQVTSQWVFPEDDPVVTSSNLQIRSEDGKKGRLSTSEEPQSHITFAQLDSRRHTGASINGVASNNLLPHSLHSCGINNFNNNNTNRGNINSNNNFVAFTTSNNYQITNSSNQNGSSSASRGNTPKGNIIQSPNARQFSSSFMMHPQQPSGTSKSSEQADIQGINFTQRTVSPASARNSSRYSGRTEFFTTINDLHINQDGVERRRNLLSRREDGIDMIRTKRESTLENTTTQGFDDTRHGKFEQSLDSLFRRKLHEESYQKSSSLTPKQIQDNSCLPIKSGDSFLPSKLDSSGNPQTEQFIKLQQNQLQTQSQQAQSSQQLLVKQSPQFYIPAGTVLPSSSGVLFDETHPTHHGINSQIHRQSYLFSPNLMKDELSRFRRTSIADGLLSNEAIRDSHCQISRKITLRNPEDSINTQKIMSSQGSQNQIGQIPNSSEGMPPMKYMTLIFIKRFINHLKKSVQSSQFKNLKENQIRLINDAAYEDEGVIANDRRMSPSQRVKTRKIIINSNRWNKAKGFGFIYTVYLRHIVISSQSIGIALFEIILLCASFIQAYLIPLKICFAGEADDAFDMITQVTIPIFILEIVLNCVTSYYKEGLEVRKQKKIIKNYLKTKFLGDVITLVSLIASFYSGKVWISIIFLGRLNRLPKLINSIDDHFQLEHRFPSSFELLKLILLIATIGHYCGCGFIYLGRYQVDNDGYSWLEYKKIESAIWDLQYLYGLYFSFITMITVGYGDITPQTSKEIIYVLFMTLLSTGTFAYSINTIGAIFREMSVKKSDLKREKYEISCYLRDRNIAKHLQIKVQKELEYFQQRQQQGEQKGDQVLQQLSLDIRNQVKRQYFGRILENYKVLKLNFSEDFIEQLSLTLKESYLSPDEVIMQQGELQNRVICLVSGELIVYQESPNNALDHIHIGKIKKGEFSDQRALFFEYNTDYGLKSSGISQMVFFTNEDFINTLKNFPQEFEKFCMLRDNILFQGKFVDLKCYCCSGFGHSTHKCDQVHFNPDVRNVISKLNQQITTQKRVNNHPRKQTKRNTWKFKTKTNERAKDKRIEIIHRIYPFYQHYLGQKAKDDELFLSKVPEIFFGEEGLVVNIEEYIDDFEDDEEINDRTQTQTSGEQKVVDRLIADDASISNIMAVAQANTFIPQSLQMQINHTDSLHLGAQTFERDRGNSAIEGEINVQPYQKQRKRSTKSRPSSSSQLDLFRSPKSTTSALASQFFLPNNQQQQAQQQQQQQQYQQQNQQQQHSSNTSLKSPHESTSAGGGAGGAIKQHIFQQINDNNNNDSNGGSVGMRNNNNNGTSEQASSKKGKMSYMNQINAMTFLPTSEQNIQEHQQEKDEQQQHHDQQMQQLQQMQQSQQGAISPKLPKLFNIGNHNNNNNIMNSQGSPAFFADNPQKLSLQQQQIPESTSLVLLPNTFSPKTPHLPYTSNPVAQPGGNSNSTEFINTSISNKPLPPLAHGNSQQTIGSECVSPLRKKPRMTTLNSRKATLKQSIIDVAKMTGYLNQNSSYFNTVTNPFNNNNNNLNFNSYNPNNTTISNTTPQDGKSANFFHPLQQLLTIGQQQQQQFGHLPTQAHFPHGSHTTNLLSNPLAINSNIMNGPICDFPYSIFDFQKNYKYYFTNGNIENIQKSYIKYQIAVISERKSFKKQLKRKLIKQLQQQILKDTNPSKYNGGRTSVLVDHTTAIPSYMKQRASYKKRLLGQTSRKLQTPTNVENQDNGDPMSLSHIS